MLDISDIPGNRVAAMLNPFNTERTDIVIPAGHTLAEIFDIVELDPYLRKSAHVFIGPDYYPADKWHVIRPKPGAVVSIRAFIAPAGNGGDILRDILLVGIAAAALFLGPAVGAALGFSGALAASVGQAVIGLGGMLLLNALVPPSAATAAASNQDPTTLFIQSAQNAASPFGVVPVPFGRNKQIPPLGGEWVTEIVGDDQYLRGLLVWGIGPLSIDESEFKIGDTLLSDFTNVQTETREGYLSDLPTTLYPNTIDQQNFSILLKSADGFQIRTSDTNADELSVDLTFISGLVTIDTSGNRSNRSVGVQIEYSVAGANSWQHIPVASGVLTFPIAWTNQSAGSFNTITFQGQTTSAARFGLTWKVPARGAYDVRIKRLTADNTLTTIQDDVQWTALRRIENIHPINSPVPVAVTAIRIKATDQLSGVISNFTGYPTRVMLDWDSGSSTWILRASQNPASAFRFALQGNAIQVPYADASIDLVQLQYWHEFCATNGFKYNENRNFQSSLWDLLGDIAAAGRASPTCPNGKYSVVIDEPKLPVQHITPRTSAGFVANKMFVDPPHAIRIPFANEDKDFAADEVRFYMDGYDATTATLFETMTFPGVTDAVSNVRHARFAAACAVQRPEIWTYSQSIERMVYRRGDVVLITHDVLLAGITSGRIKSVMFDGGGNAIGVTVDENLPMDAFQFYGMAIRTVDTLDIAAQVVNSPGDNLTVMFVTPILASIAPQGGELFGFGILGQVTDSAIILSVSPTDSVDFNATISAVPYRTVVYDIDGDTIPPFNSNITPIAPVPDVAVVAIRSDESVLTVGAGNSLNVHINVKVQALASGLDGKLDVVIRPSTSVGPFSAAQVDSYINNEVSIGDVRTGEYVDIGLRWNVQGRVGTWTYAYNNLIVGKSTDPNPLANLTLATFGGQAFLRWDEPTELDVLFGGTVHFRFSTDPVPGWNNSTSIGDVAQARSLIATLPLKPGTYLARVFDASNNQSTVVSINTKQASVLTYANVSSIDEAPTFSGTKTNCLVDDSNNLRIDAAGLFDDMVDVDAETDIDNFGGTETANAATYQFALGFDFGTVQLVRLTTRLNSFNAAIFDLIDDWIGDFDDRADFDGSDIAACDCTIYVSTTDNDPASGGAIWTQYQRLDSMEVNCRGCRFQAILDCTNSDFNIFVSVMGIDAEKVV